MSKMMIKKRERERRNMQERRKRGQKEDGDRNEKKNGFSNINKISTSLYIKFVEQKFSSKDISDYLTVNIIEQKI